ncbi:type III secretion system inner rod subunit SctI [Kosakonia sp. BYX6]|uniref:Type III secretion system inner rod subunit SctI n=1 Tax=Kosakonia calanthes TaxID=3139408 RepID=A0ABZ3B9V2_9ENTR
MNIINHRSLPIDRMLTVPDEPPTQQQADRFSALLQADLPSGAVSPQEMLTRQLNTVGLTVGVDLCAKLTGSVSQSINKLVNMT